MVQYKAKTYPLGKVYNFQLRRDLQCCKNCNGVNVKKYLRNFSVTSIVVYVLIYNSSHFNGSFNNGGECNSIFQVKYR